MWWMKCLYAISLLPSSNPKVILFYCGFLPAFMNLKTLSYIEISLVAVIVSTIMASVLTVYALLASKMRRFLFRSKFRKYVNRMTGGTMIATGVTLVARS